MPQIERPITPMLERLRMVGAEVRTLHEFFEWLQSSEQHWDKEVNDLHIGDLVHEYFELDRKQIEEERRALLDYQRRLNEVSEEVQA